MEGVEAMQAARTARRDERLLTPVARLDSAAELASRITLREAQIAVMGIGYAGLPMAVEFARAGFDATGIDVSEDRVRRVNFGRSPVSDVADSDIAELVESLHLRATTQFEALAEADVVFVCVPTPVTEEREPDLRYVRAAAASIAEHLHRGMLIILQSTCPPGTTRRVLLPALAAHANLRIGRDYFVAFAPERIDPGNKHFNVGNTPKLVGGVTARCTEVASLLFEQVAHTVVPVSSPDVAEMAKLVENSFRFINISFANELAILCDRLGVSVWEVIDAAATKPFAFMAHYPGPGVGGECIPIVPFHLEAVARENGTSVGLIEQAGQVNDRMPAFVADKLERLLAERGISLAEARVLVLGVAYKPNVSDTRESAALRVFSLLRERARTVEYYDPYVPTIRCGASAAKSLTAEEVSAATFDCALLLTAHANVDYDQILGRVELVLDTQARLPADNGWTVVRL